MEEKKSLLNKIKGKLSIRKVLVIVLVIGVVAFGASRFLPGKKSSMPAFQTNGTRTTTLRRQVLNDSVTVTGTVESTQTVNVTSKATGMTVKEIKVQEGDYVEEGDVIALLDTADLLENIAKVKEKLTENQETAQRNYDQAETDMNNAYDNCIAQETVLKDATAARDEALKNFNLAKSAVATQQTAYDSARAAAQTANNVNNKNIAVMNEKYTAYVNASSALSTASSKLSAATDAYNNAAEDAENKAELKAAMDAARSEYEAAEKTAETAESEYSVAYNAVYDGATGSNAAYETAKANEKTALENLNNAKSQANYSALETAYNTAEKTRQSARTTLDSLQKIYTNAVTSFEKAEDNLANASTSDELEELYEKYSNCTIKANASGTITRVNTTVGSVANGTIAVIQDTDNLKISTSFREYDVQNIEIGMQCIITSDANDKQLSGYVSQISPVASSGGMGSSDVSFAAEVTINGNDHGLLIGMNAQAEIIITQVSDAYVVPYDAVGTNENGEKVVYVQDGEDFTPVVVTTGMETDYYIEITSDELKDGMVIRSSADEDESQSVVFTEDGETLEEGGFDMGMMGGFGGGNMPSGGTRPSGGNMPTGGMPGGRG